MYSSSTWYKQAITAKFYVFFKLIKAYFYSIGPQTFKAGYYGKKKKRMKKIRQLSSVICCISILFGTGMLLICPLDEVFQMPVSKYLMSHFLESIKLSWWNFLVHCFFILYLYFVVTLLFIPLFLISATFTITLWTRILYIYINIFTKSPENWHVGY